MKQCYIKGECLESKNWSGHIPVRKAMGFLEMLQITSASTFIKLNNFRVEENLKIFSPSSHVDEETEAEKGSKSK